MTDANDQKAIDELSAQHNATQLDALNDAGRFPELEEAALQILFHTPNHPAAQKMLAAALERQGKRGATLDIFLSIFSRTQPAANALYAAVTTLLKLHALDKVGGRATRGEQAFALLTLDQVSKREGISSFVAVPGTAVGKGHKVHNISKSSVGSDVPFQSLPQYGMRISEAECVWPNIVLQGDALLNANNGYGSAELAVLGGMDRYPLRVSGYSGELLLSLEDSARKEEMPEPVGLLTTSSNYSSWMLGEIPRLHLYESQFATKRFLLHGKALPFHFDTLNFFGIDQSRLIVLNGETSAIVKDLHLSSPTYMHHNFATDALAWVRNKFLARCENANGPAQKKSIYVSRSRLGAGQYRLIENELEIEEFLAARGFEIMHPQELSFEEQASGFHSAERIMSPFGAALANGLFCKAGAKICVIETKSTPEFKRLFQWRGLEVCTIKPERRVVAAGKSLSEKYKFVVDLKHLEKFIDITEI